MQSKAMTLETARRTLEELLLPAGAKALPVYLIASVASCLAPVARTGRRKPRC